MTDVHDGRAAAAAQSYTMRDTFPPDAEQALASAAPQPYYVEQAAKCPVIRQADDFVTLLAIGSRFQLSTPKARGRLRRARDLAGQAHRDSPKRRQEPARPTGALDIEFQTSCTCWQVVDPV